MKIDEKTGLVALTLQRGFAVYNKGETAGFLPEQARQLVAGGVAVPYDPQAKAEPVSALDSAAETLAARVAELDAWERALAEREAALMSAPTTQAAEAVTPADAEPVAASAADKGAPPKQGSK